MIEADIVLFVAGLKPKLAVYESLRNKNLASEMSLLASIKLTVMKTLFVINEPPYGSERVYNALRELAPVV